MEILRSDLGYLVRHHHHLVDRIDNHSSDTSACFRNVFSDGKLISINLSGRLLTWSEALISFLLRPCDCQVVVE